jgi:hypothetical protein
MPSLAEYLHGFIAEAQSGTAGLADELAALKKREQEIEGRLSAAREAAQRGRSYLPMSGLDRYCPRCCVFEGRLQQPLKAIGGGTRLVDHFRCERCAFEYELDAGLS